MDVVEGALIDNSDGISNDKNGEAADKGEPLIVSAAVEVTERVVDVAGTSEAQKSVNTDDGAAMMGD